jgi:4-hydroxyproline epimerase
MTSPDTFRVIDSHTEGEPTRVIVGGGPALNATSMAERRREFSSRFDHYHSALCNEPRGSEVMVGALLCDPESAGAECGVIFFNNVGVLGMCGHGLIGVIATLAYLGRAGVGAISVDTPAGTVQARRAEDQTIAIDNVHSYRYRKSVPVTLGDGRRFVGDIAYGGNWFFLISDHHEHLVRANTGRLTTLCVQIMQALRDQKITGEDGHPIDHIELFAPPSDPIQADSINFVLCPGGVYDRSPCGTGTSAKLACLAADGKLAPGARWRQQSITGGQFSASYRLRGDDLIPTIVGRAFVNADINIIVDPQDPLAWGMRSA